MPLPPGTGGKQAPAACCRGMLARACDAVAAFTHVVPPRQRRAIASLMITGATTRLHDET